jgi:hypothetical protein
MQLESTLFAICVVQIKPQLEKLLKLPPDGLTKEIKLTQELLSLFIEYQIPSDLLSYDGPPDATAAEKLARVAEYTGRMREMIELSKKRELEEEREREAMRLAEMNRSFPPEVDRGMPYGAPPGFAGGAVAVAGPPMAVRRPSRAAPAAPPAFAPPQPAPAAPPPPPAASAPREHAARAQEAVARSEHGGDRLDHGSAADGTPAGGADARDYTKIPAELDRRFEELDEDAALHATIIHPGNTWSRTAQKGLLTAPVTSRLASNEQKSEKSKAFDLLDALTKSGALTIEDASLHVVIAASHCFDRTLLETVIQDNVNPIEKVERSLMIVGATIFGLPAAELLADDQRERFFGASPKLRLPGEEPEAGSGRS